MATLIDVATPGPALSAIETDGSTLGINSNSVIEAATASTYQLNTITLTAGTWVVTGIVKVAVSADQTNYLSLSSAVRSNSWPVQISSVSNNMVISAVVKVTGSTAIYLNGNYTIVSATCNSLLTATRIQ
jgi:hypothetical protein